MTKISRTEPLLALFAAALGLASPLSARQEAPATLCLAAAEEAARATGVPLRVLVALTLTETGRAQSGRLDPWPWALNEGGTGQWFDTREDALAYLSDAVLAGTENIDVGCFQLNYRWHGAAFASLDAMMDPRTNALYAADLMARLYGETGDWMAAAAAYHSSTPDLAEKYMSRFEPVYAALGDADPDPEAQAIAEAAPPRNNRFPLLQGGVSGAGGSLVPMTAGSGPLFGG